MARLWFGGTSDDYVYFTVPFGANRVVSIGSTTTLTFWSLASGGTQYTDLLLGGSPVTSITTANGFIPAFQGPDGVTQMWVDSGTGTRTLMQAEGVPGPTGPVASVVGQTGAVTGAQIAADPALSGTYAQKRTYDVVADGGADPTAGASSDLGAIITAAATALAAAGGGTITGPVGSYRIKTTATINAKNVSLVFPGSSQTTFIADAALGSATPAVDLSNRAAFSPYNSSRFGGFFVSGTSNPTGIGVNYGDIIGGHIDDIVVDNFKGAGGIGWQWINRAMWTERTFITRLQIGFGNTIGMAYTVAGGQSSFGYQRWSHVGMNISKVAIGGGNGASVAGCSFATVTSGTTYTVTNAGGFTGVTNGMTVDGPGILGGTTVVSGAGTTTLTLSAPLVNLVTGVRITGSVVTVGSASISGTSVTVASGGFPSMSAGQMIDGPGIPHGTIITNITGNTLTLSQAAWYATASTTIASYTPQGSVVTIGGIITSGSATVTVTSGANFLNGMVIVGLGIPAGTTLTSGGGTTTFTLSASATTIPLAFINNAQVGILINAGALVYNSDLDCIVNASGGHGDGVTDVAPTFIVNNGGSTGGLELSRVCFVGESAGGGGGKVTSYSGGAASTLDVNGYMDLQGYVGGFILGAYNVAGQIWDGFQNSAFQTSIAKIPRFKIEASSAGTALDIGQGTQPFSSFSMDGLGGHYWGPAGAGSFDTQLTRTARGVLTCPNTIASVGLQPNAGATTLNGTTTGTAIWAEPFSGSACKKVIVQLNAYENTTGTAQTITFPTPFTGTPYLAKDDSGGATVSSTTLTLPASMGATKTGWIVVEGF